MSNSQGNDKIYDELRGYFPPEYDLTPDELEKEIELENKKREIALGMMRTHLSENLDEAEAKQEKPEAKKQIAPEPIAEVITELETVTVGEAKESAPKAEEASAEAQTDEDDSFIVDFSELDAYLTSETDEDSELDIINEEIVDASHSEDGEEAALAPIEDDPALFEANIDDGLYTENEYDTAVFSSIEDEDRVFNDLRAAFEEEEAAEEEGKRDPARKAVNWIFDFLEIFAVCITCIIVIFALFFRLTQVSGDSMQNTLLDKEYLVVSDFMYTPKVGDIVVLQNTSLHYEQLKGPLVKRVIAVGGQKVSISGEGIVTVTDADGTSRVLTQPYVKQEPYKDVVDEYTVPEGYIFVMGDNRNHSTDSRSNLVGVVDERCVFGKAIMRILPVTKFTVFENPYDN